MNADLVILGFLVAPREVGLYAAILGLTNAGIQFSSMIRQVIFSRIVRSYKSQSTNKFRIINFICLKYGTILGLFFGFFGSFFAKPIIDVIFGGNFLEAVPSFQIIIWVVALNLMGISLPHALMTHDRYSYFRVNLYCGILNIILNFIFIPILGIMGAALSYLLSTFFWIASFYYIVCKKNDLLSIDLFGLLAKPLLSFSICGVFLYLFSSVSAYITLALSLAIYICVLFLTKYISISEIKSDLLAI
jgi:O-antigen/teichoic acid export membrane protein